MSSNVSPSSPTTSPPTKSSVVRTRRSKGKSRFGCKRCKISRVKCDEKKPECSRCMSFSEPCLYTTTQTAKWKASTSTLVFTSTKGEMPFARKRKDIESSTTSYCTAVEFLQKLRAPDPPQLLPRIPALPKEYIEKFDTEDVFLLRHFTTSTSGGLWGSQQIWVDEGVPLAFQHPFLMHAVMCLAARHLQTLPDDDAGYPKSNYSRLETVHYEKALSICASVYLHIFYG